MASLKVLGILTLIAIGFTFLCLAGEAESGTTGFWALVVIGLATAQSIVGIVQSKTKVKIKK